MSKRDVSERKYHNPRVGGSSPSSATNFFHNIQNAERDSLLSTQRDQPK